MSGPARGPDAGTRDREPPLLTSPLGVKPAADTLIVSVRRELDVLTGEALGPMLD